jgi:hypothetical protein
MHAQHIRHQLLTHTCEGMRAAGRHAEVRLTGDLAGAFVHGAGSVEVSPDEGDVPQPGAGPGQGVRAAEIFTEGQRPAASGEASDLSHTCVTSGEQARRSIRESSFQQQRTWQIGLRHATIYPMQEAPLPVVDDRRPEPTPPPQEKDEIWETGVWQLESGQCS